MNLDCDRKFRNFWGSSKAIQRLSDTLCIQNGLSIIEQPKGRGKSYNKWLGNEAKISQRDVLRKAIDAALERQPKDFEELLTIPKVKEIQAEYDTLREKKKQVYAAYHQAQDEMRQLLTVRANVERILGVEEKEKERQAEKKKER